VPSVTLPTNRICSIRTRAANDHGGVTVKISKDLEARPMTTASISFPRARLAAWLAVAFLIAGCAAVPRVEHTTQMFAWPEPQKTPLGSFFAERQPEQDLSGFLLLDDPRDAFRIRYGAAAQATHTLDLQYYLWKGDLTGRLLLWRALQAADRGVRVRILIDDIYHTGRDDTYALIAAHPNVDLRVFNPMGNRNAGRHVNYVLNRRQLNHRMHNKIFLVDNAVAVLGGRNIGDDYFGIDPKLNFHDLDVLAVGPIAAEAGAAFDLYWNSSTAVPIEQLSGYAVSPSDLAEFQRTLADRLRSEIGAIPYEVPGDAGEVEATLERLASQMTWARGRIVVDPLERFEGEESAFNALGREIAAAADEMVTIQTAYLIPSESAIAGMDALVDRGVRVRVMTNSLMSNNHVSVHAHYRKYRKAILEAGVELYELRADAALLEHYKQEDPRLSASHSGLHTKAFVVDDDLAVIGSYNMDPRSNLWNSEIALVVYGQEFGRKVLAEMNEEFQSDNAFLLELDADGDVIWRLACDDCTEVWTKEPDSTWWKRFSAGFIGILPIESEL
jgi:putative cardiolipin synthase